MTSPHSPAALVGRLVRFHASGHRLGLASDAADALVRALKEGVPAERALRSAGLDPRLALPCEQAGVTDVVAALDGLLLVVARTVDHERRLRAAGDYALVLCGVVAFSAALVFGVFGPAMDLLPLGGGPTERLPLLAPLAVALVLLALVALVVHARLPLPGLGQGWRRLDGFAFLSSLRVLVAAGADLPAAIRAAAQDRDRTLTARALDLARALEAGQTPGDLHPLLTPFEASMFLGAARSGVVGPTLEALVASRGVALDVEIPAQAARIHGTTLVVAAVALLVLGATFFSVYASAVVG